MQFRDVIGQMEAKNRLAQIANSGKIPHALMILGPDGSGSLPLAIAYAQYINCLDPKENDSCGTCSSCRKYEKFIHPDLHFSFPFVKIGDIKTTDPLLPQWRTFLEENPYRTHRQWLEYCGAENKQGNIPNEECKQFIQKLSLMAFEAKYKVLILWMPEFLGNSGNILLKLIEEPPSQTLFIFVARETEPILPTIMSRVQTLKVSGIESDILSKYLVTHHHCEEEKAQGLANLSEGNLNEALRLLNDDAEQSEELFKEWMRACFSLPVSASKLNEWVSMAHTLGREKQKNLLDYGLFIIREAFLHKFGASKINRLTAKEFDFVEKFAPLLNEKNVPILSKILSDGYTFIERNGYSKIVFHALSLEINAAFKK